MQNVYMKIPAISDDLMTALRESDAFNRETGLGSELRLKRNLLAILHAEVPGADTYRTKFAHLGLLYCIDTDGFRLEEFSYIDKRLNMIVGEPERPAPVVVTVEKPTGISEGFLLRAVAVACHGEAAAHAFIQKA